LLRWFFILSDFEKRVEIKNNLFFTMKKCFSWPPIRPELPMMSRFNPYSGEIE
jgi:hypothetical protein